MAYFAVLDPSGLIGEELVAEVLDGNALADYTDGTWLSTGVKVFGDAQVILQGGVGVVPDAKEMNLAADLLAPLAIVMAVSG